MKRSIKVTLACIPLVAVPITHVSGISNENINKEKLNENNYEAIANQVKNKHNVKNWIKGVHSNGFQNYDNDVKSLYNLDLTDIQKEFLKENLQEKYQIRNMNNRKRVRRRINAEDWGGGGGGGTTSSVVYLKLPTKMQEEVIDLNGNKIPSKGPNYSKATWQSKDFTFKTDVSYLNWNNQTILEHMIASGLKETNFKERFNKIEHELNEYTLYKKMYDEGKGRPGSFGLRNSKEGRYYLSGGFLERKINEIKTLNNELSNYTGIDFSSVLEKKIEIKESVNKNIQDSPPINGHKLFVIGKWTGWVTYTSTKILLLGGTLGPLGIGLAIGSIILDSILLSAKSGNGYTYSDNINDQGLNEWNFQMKKNYKTIVKIAHEWSNNYQHPITWKVTDGWFTSPELRISRGTIRYKGGPKGTWTKLCPFSDGKKTLFWKYSSKPECKTIYSYDPTYGGTYVPGAPSKRDSKPFCPYGGAYIPGANADCYK